MWPCWFPRPDYYKKKTAYNLNIHNTEVLFWDLWKMFNFNWGKSCLIKISFLDASWRWDYHYRQMSTFHQPFCPKQPLKSINTNCLNELFAYLRTSPSPHKDVPQPTFCTYCQKPNTQSTDKFLNMIKSKPFGFHALISIIQITNLYNFVNAIIRTILISILTFFLSVSLFTP